MPTYGDLFDYLTSRPEGEEPRTCDHTLRFTKQFAEAHDLCFEDLSRILGEMYGYCDCEVLMNAAFRIPPEDVIGKETFKTPVQIAIEKGLYCNCLVDGKPASHAELVAAGRTGRKVEAWVPYGKDDPHAMPDVNRAIASQIQSEE